MVSSTSSIYSHSHSEFHSVTYCFKHPSFTQRYYCETCKQALCEDCWAEDHRDKTKHLVVLMKVFLEPQIEVQTRLAEYKAECQSMAKLCKGGCTSILRQTSAAEKKQSNVMKSKSANELETKSKELRELLRVHLNDMKEFKSKILMKFDDLEAKLRAILNDSVESEGGRISRGSSSSTIGDDAHSSKETEGQICGLEGTVVSRGAVGGESGREDVSFVGGKREVVVRKKRTLVGVERKAMRNLDFLLLHAVYNTETKEVLCCLKLEFSVNAIGAIAVYGSNESSGLFELKRTVNWYELRGEEDQLWSIAIDSNYVLYGGIRRKSDSVSRVEILDQNTLEKKGQLDTDGIENGRGTLWLVAASGQTVVVTVIDHRKSDSKWTSVTVFKNQQRQHTVSFDIAIDGDVPYISCILANQTSLLLNCGSNTNRVAVVSLPLLSSDSTGGSKSQTKAKPSSPKTSRADETKARTSTTSALKPQSVICIILSELKDAYSIVWMPSDRIHSSAHLLTGHLWAADGHSRTSRVYELDIKNNLSQSESENEITLHSMSNIAPLEETEVLCRIDDATILATDRYKPFLLHLNYQTTV